MFKYKKILILSSVVSSCLLTLTGYNLSSDTPKCYSGNAMHEQGYEQAQPSRGMQPGSRMDNSYTQMQNRMNAPTPAPGRLHDSASKRHQGDMMLPSNKMGRVSKRNGDEMMPSKVLRADSVDRFSGTIKSVKKIPYPDGTQIHIVVDTDQGEMTVVLGPEKHLNQQMVKLMTGDKIRVHGYRVTANGDMVFMASEITKNGNVLKLRDSKRRPVWRENPHNGQSSANNFWRS